MAPSGSVSGLLACAVPRIDTLKHPLRALYAVTDDGAELVAEARDPVAGIHALAAELPPGVYTALGTRDRVRFLALEAHLDRLERNLGELGFGLPFDRARIRRALDTLVRAYPGPEARLRIDVLAEPRRSEAESNPAARDATVFIAIAPHRPVPAEFRERGVAVRLTTELRRPRPEIKSTAFVAERDPFPLQTHECYEHVMVDEAGRLLEGTSANFYGVRDGAVHTSPDGVLEGIARELVYRVASELGIDVVGRAVTVADYAGLDEAFLTSSTRGVLPVVEIEGARIGDGTPGPVTRGLAAGFEELAAREARPALEGEGS